MVDDDVYYGFRLRLFSMPAELGNVSAACRMFGIHRSTTTAGTGWSQRYGLEMLRPRERRAPRMPNQTSELVEERVIAFAIGPPGARDRAGSAPASPRSAGAASSSAPPACGGCCAATASPAASAACRSWPAMRRPPSPRGGARARCDTSRSTSPGELVGFDCFHVGRLAGTTGRVWQYTAIDHATSYVWAELHTTPLNPSCAQRSAWRAGWRRTSRDTAGASSVPSPTTAREFRSRRLRRHPARAGRDADVHPRRATDHQRRGRAGPAHDPRGVLAASFARSLVPKLDGPRPRPRGVPALLQRGARPHRAADRRGAPRWSLDRSAQDEADDDRDASFREAAASAPSESSARRSPRSSSSRRRLPMSRRRRTGRGRALLQCRGRFGVPGSSPVAVAVESLAPRAAGAARSRRSGLAPRRNRRAAPRSSGAWRHRRRAPRGRSPRTAGAPSTRGCAGSRGRAAPSC